jgi:DNA-binding response OmpR family regulator
LRLLIIEDNRKLAASLKRALAETSYAVDVAYDGESGQSLAENAPYDLIVLDIVLPQKDGFAVCRALRDRKIASRILMLTQKRAVADRVTGLDCGADDYLAKPFVIDELLARVRALLRRGSDGSPLIKTGDITLDTVNRQVKRGGTDIILRPREYAILHFLMAHAGITVTRSMIEDHVWNIDLESGSHLLDVYISNLRKKLGEGVIETVRGVGYRVPLSPDK